MSTRRIVLFADVHGNITGLRAIMKEVEKLENVEHIIGLGDYFGWGAGCDDIIDLCLEHHVTLIRGGHEEIHVAQPEVSTVSNVRTSG